MDFVLTTAGLQALINVSETGTNAIELTHIGIGSGKYTPTKAQTALQSQIKTHRIIEGGQAGDNAIHVAARDADAVTYEAFEVGIFTSTGTLFAVTSQTTPIIQKPKASAYVFMDAARSCTGMEVSLISGCSLMPSSSE